MNRILPLFVGALAFGGLVGTAEAGHGHGGGGHSGGGGHFSHSSGGGFHASAHVSGGASVHVGAHFSRPAHYGHYGNVHGGYGHGHYGWHGGGRIIVGGGYYYGWPYYYGYYPEYVPSYYGTTYYPVSARPATASYGAQVAAVAPAPLPKLAVGLSAGSVSTSNADGTSTQDSTDLAILGRLRLGEGGLFVEGEIGKTSYQNDQRVDRRIGGSLVYEIGTRNRLAPYVLAGIGVQQADVNGDYNTTQDFAEIGVGLRYAITPRFHIAADIRGGSRSTVSNDDSGRPVLDSTITPPTKDSGQSEDYTRATVKALLYF